MTPNVTPTASHILSVSDNPDFPVGAFSPPNSTFIICLEK